MAELTPVSLKQIFKDKIPFALVAASILISYFLVRTNEVVTLIVFVILVPIFTIFRYDGRIPIVYAVLLVIIIAAAEFTKQQVIADQVSIFVYWLLVVGTICLLIEYFRKSHSS